MKNNEFRNNLAQLGFPLLEVTQETDANVTLVELVQSRDMRLWEGFPVVLAFSNEMGLFDRQKSAERLTDDRVRESFGLLLALSLALYRFLELRFAWANGLLAGLTDREKAAYEDALRKFKTGADLQVGEHRLSCQRLKTNFDQYFRRTGESMRELLSSREEMVLERALSQVFSPKQKELFLKKLRSEKMTKTEKEYFSRVVRKKVMALANADMHRLAQKLSGV